MSTGTRIRVVHRPHGAGFSHLPERHMKDMHRLDWTPTATGCGHATGHPADRTCTRHCPAAATPLKGTR